MGDADKNEMNHDVLPQDDRAFKRATLQRLVRLRSDLLRKHPFFGDLAMTLDLGIAECETAYTDMKKLRVDPGFAKKLSDEELKFVLMHEILHCVLKHPLRGRSKNQWVYNVACDIVVNSNIMDYLEVSEFYVAGYPAMHLTPSGKEGKLKTADEVYDELMKDDKFLKDNEDEIYPDGIPDCSEGSGNPDDSGSSQDSPKSESSEGGGKKCGPGGISNLDNHEIWTELDEDIPTVLLDNVIKDYGSKGWGRGLVPHAVRNIYEEAERLAKLEWRKALREFLSENIPYTDYNFAPPDRRFSDGEYLLPGDNDQDQFHISRVWFVVDTSGSISVTQLTRFMGEIIHAIKDSVVKESYISFFDEEVTDPQRIDEENVDIIKPEGGGGTDFGCIFQYLADHTDMDSPKAIIILTDGYAPDIPEEMAMDIPVIWVLIDNEVDKPWGKSVHIDTKLEDEVFAKNNS